MFQKVFLKRGLSFDRLRALVELAEAGSLAKAADGDPTRQSQYSRQIKELEDHFGVRLTARRGNRLELSAAGRRLVEIGRETFITLGDFQAACEQQPQMLTIASGASLLQWLVLPKLGDLQRAHPGLSVQLEDLRTSEIVEGLCEMRLDLGILRESALVPPLKSVRLFRLSYSLFVPEPLLPAGKASDWRDVLKGVPWALQASGGQFHQAVEAAARKHGLPLRPALCCVSFTQASGAVLTGRYAAVLPSIAAADFKAGGVVELPLPILKGYARVLCLAWNPRLSRLRPEVDKVIQRFPQMLKGGS